MNRNEACNKFALFTQAAVTVRKITRSRRVIVIKCRKTRCEGQFSPAKSVALLVLLYYQPSQYVHMHMRAHTHTHTIYQKPENFLLRTTRYFVKTEKVQSNVMARSI